MTTSTSHHDFPLARVSLALTAAGAALALVALGVVAGLHGDTSALLGVVIGCAIAYVAALVSLLPVWFYGARGTQQIVAAYFAGMGGRLVLCLAAGLGVVYLWRLPGDATLLALAGTYLALLVVEVRFVGRYIAVKGAPTAGQPVRAPGGCGLIRYFPILAAEDLMSHVLPHRIKVFHLGPLVFKFTNHALMTLAAAVLLVLVFIYVARRMKGEGEGVEKYVTHGRLAQFFEVICVFLREEVARPALGDLTDKYIVFIWNTFFFILFCNLLGMVPTGAFLRLITGQHRLEHWGGTATGNLAVTVGLAVIAFVMIHAVGIHENGWRYFRHFNPGPWYMAPLMVPLEVFGSFVKPFALAMRLFANMVAGHLVLAALLGMIVIFKNYGVVAGSVLGAAALSLLELFVAFLQAYIFTFLTVLFIAAGAVHSHGGHEPDSMEGHGQEVHGAHGVQEAHAPHASH